MPVERGWNTAIAASLSSTRRYVRSAVSSAPNVEDVAYVVKDVNAAPAATASSRSTPTVLLVPLDPAEFGDRAYSSDRSIQLTMDNANRPSSRRHSEIKDRSIAREINSMLRIEKQASDICAIVPLQPGAVHTPFPFHFQISQHVYVSLPVHLIPPQSPSTFPVCSRHSTSTSTAPAIEA
jgi:hypothetical protein